MIEFISNGVEFLMLSDFAEELTLFACLKEISVWFRGLTTVLSAFQNTVSIVFQKSNFQPKG